MNNEWLILCCIYLFFNIYILISYHILWVISHLIVINVLYSIFKIYINQKKVYHQYIDILLLFLSIYLDNLLSLLFPTELHFILSFSFVNSHVEFLLWPYVYLDPLLKFIGFSKISYSYSLEFSSMQSTYKTE